MIKGYFHYKNDIINVKIEIFVQLNQEETNIYPKLRFIYLIGNYDIYLVSTLY